ncbi:sulfatase-like hydrolase/transferase, partial [Candidatus Latescibacterota bacterium]
MHTLEETHSMNIIDRRLFLSMMASGCAGLSATSLISCSREVPPAQKPPNIIVILADDAGWADVGYHGSEINTPNIDRLVDEGVELDRFYVYPVCSPTRAALLTGRPPSRFGILGPIVMRSTLALPDDATTLAEMLRDTGYDTAITGKWHLGLRPEVGPGKYGFTHTYGYLHGQIDQFTHYYKNGDRS